MRPRLSVVAITAIGAAAVALAIGAVVSVAADAVPGQGAGAVIGIDEPDADDGDILDVHYAAWGARVDVAHSYSAAYVNTPGERADADPDAMVSNTQIGVRLDTDAKREDENAAIAVVQQARAQQHDQEQDQEQEEAQEQPREQAPEVEQAQFLLAIELDLPRGP